VARGRRRCNRSQDQGHGGGFLQAGTLRDLGGKLLAPLGPLGEPALYEGFDIVGVAQRFELTEPMALIIRLDKSW
jgi:hypothetical protein